MEIYSPSAIDARPDSERIPDLLKTSVSQGVVSAMASNGDLPDRADIFGPDFTSTCFRHCPEVRTSFFESLNAALFAYRATEEEIRKVGSAFSDERRLLEKFRFFRSADTYHGYYQYPYPDGDFRNATDYLSAVVNHPDWGLFVNVRLVGKEKLNGVSVDPMAGTDFRLTIRHELDHLVCHLLTILRTYENPRQMRRTLRENPLFSKKMELCAFYAQANLSIGLKGAGAEIEWDEILDRHTGWNTSLGDTPEDYRGVVEHMRAVFVTRNALYNALLRKHEYDPRATNRYAAIAPEGMAEFSTFCDALFEGFRAIQTEAELEVFLTFVARLSQGLPENSTGSDMLLTRAYRPDSKVLILPSYAAFVRRLQ